MAQLIEGQCTQCGKWDTAPKSHWNNGESYHFDCLPWSLKQEFIESHPLAAKHVEAAESGIHDDELRVHLANLHAGA